MRFLSCHVCEDLRVPQLPISFSPINSFFVIVIWCSTTCFLIGYPSCQVNNSLRTKLEQARSECVRRLVRKKEEEKSNVHETESRLQMLQEEIQALKATLQRLRQESV